MRESSDSYLLYKQELKDIWSFAVMVCYAAPTLSKNIKAIENSIENYSLPKPDYFTKDKSSFDTMKTWVKPAYKKKLATYLWISGFSFFEAYVVQVIEELLAQHGGAEAWESVARSDNQDLYSVHDSVTLAAKRKLLGPYDPSKQSRYQQKIEFLKSNHYRFPSMLLSAWGIHQLRAAIKELKASEIPNLLSRAFDFQLTTDELKTFTGIKDRRNRIAHGRPGKINLNQVIEMNRFLRSIASRFDKHLVSHFFVHERVR